jgi:transposase
MRGRPGGEEIARTLGVTRRSVNNVRIRWRLRGLPGLQDCPRLGRPPRADEAYRTGAASRRRTGPALVGLRLFAVDGSPPLGAPGEAVGVQLSTPQLPRLLHGQRFAWRRTKRSLRNFQGATAVAQTHGALAHLKIEFLRRIPAPTSGSATK